MKSREIALCGMMNALAVVIMNLGGIVPMATFCTPILAMIVLLPVLEEYGAKMGWCAWAAVSLLSLMQVADRETAFVYVFFGWYPMVRPAVNAIPAKAVRLAVKLLIANAVMLLLYGGIGRLLGFSADLMEAAKLMNLALLALGNVTFLLMDLVLGRMTLLWCLKWRKYFFK